VRYRHADSALKWHHELLQREAFLAEECRVSQMDYNKAPLSQQWLHTVDFDSLYFPFLSHLLLVILITLTSITLLPGLKFKLHAGRRSSPKVKVVSMDAGDPPGRCYDFPGDPPTGGCNVERLGHA
jgi:hypothetical protein